MITLIVARARDGAIGRAGEIPWHAPEDLRMFQRETAGGALIMGRNTWDSLPVRPLPKRFNCVVTRDAGLTEHVFGGVDDAVEACYSAGYTRVYGIGGARIYGEMLPLADRLLITEVDLEIEGADTYFPDFDLSAWHHNRSLHVRADAPRCELREYLRRR